jgi:hypothetical protein
MSSCLASAGHPTLLSQDISTVAFGLAIDSTSPLQMRRMKMVGQSNGRMSTDEVLQEMYEIWLSECGGTSESSLSPVQLTFILQQKGSEVAGAATSIDIPKIRQDFADFGRMSKRQ